MFKNLKRQIELGGGQSDGALCRSAAVAAPSFQQQITVDLVEQPKIAEEECRDSVEQVSSAFCDYRVKNRELLAKKDEHIGRLEQRNSALEQRLDELRGQLSSSSVEKRAADQFGDDEEQEEDEKRRLRQQVAELSAAKQRWQQSELELTKERDELLSENSRRLVQQQPSACRGCLEKSKELERLHRQFEAERRRHCQAIERINTENDKQVLTAKQTAAKGLKEKDALAQKVALLNGLLSRSGQQRSEQCNGLRNAVSADGKAAMELSFERDVLAEQKLELQKAVRERDVQTLRNASLRQELHLEQQKNKQLLVKNAETRRGNTASNLVQDSAAASANSAELLGERDRTIQQLQNRVKELRKCRCQSAERQQREEEEERRRVGREYTKNVVLKFITTSSDSEAAKLVKAVGTLLRLSAAEEALIKQALKRRHDSWFRPFLPLLDGKR